MNFRSRILHIAFLFFALFLFSGIQAQSIDSLELRNVDSTMLRLNKFGKNKALVLVFTGNHCVYSKKYESRLIRIATEAKNRDIAFCMINSNNPEMSQDDRFALMQQRAKENNYPCPYLQDIDGKLAKLLGATKNPEVFVLRKIDSEWRMLYSGKIDDNPLIEEKVEQKYLMDVLDKIANGDFAPSTSIPAVGCNIKMEE